MKISIKIITVLIFISGVLNGQAVLVKDIYPGFLNDSREDPEENQIVINNIAYFSADNGLHGKELWRSDGTEIGTVLIKDIHPGEESSHLTNFQKLRELFFFFADDGATGMELWKSDGTETGTSIVKDIAGGGDSYYSFTAFSVLNDKLYFAANDDISGVELWVSDGSETGTKMVKDIELGSDSGNPRDFAVYKEHLYFFSNDALWKSDGTEAGTTILSDAVKDSTIIIPSSKGFFFLGYNSDTEKELWFSDGTETGTHLVKDIFDGTVFSGALLSREDKNFVILDDKLLFVGFDQTNRSQLWISDGTEAGTKMLTDLTKVGDSGQFSAFTKIGDKVFFAGNGLLLGREPWITDGTKEGTNMIRDLEEGFRGSSGFNPQYVAFKNRLFFYAEVDFQQELWETDGTPENTLFVANPNPTGRSDIGDFMVVNDSVLLFFGDDDIHGRELMKFMEPAALAVSINIENNLSCAGDSDGKLEAIGTGGYPPYNYYWQDGSINQEDISNLSAGEYTVTVVDSRVTIGDDTLVLVAPSPIQIGTPTIINQTSSQANGSIEVNSILGGTPPYTILWSSGDTTFILSDLMGGTYNFAIEDANGCSILSSVVVENTSSVDENLISKVLIYPTFLRSGEKLQIRNLPDFLKYSIEIYNALGREVYQNSTLTGPADLDLPVLNNGSYFLKLRNDNQVFVKQIILVR